MNQNVVAVPVPVMLAPKQSACFMGGLRFAPRRRVAKRAVMAELVDALA